MTSNQRRPLSQSKWFLPAFCAAMGAVMLAAEWAGGQFGVGLAVLGVMLALAVLLLVFGSRSETVRAMRGDGRDERFAMIDLHATAFAGLALTVAVIVGWLVEVARGHNGNPYTWLGATAGLAYLAAAGYLRWRG